MHADIDRTAAQTIGVVIPVYRCAEHMEKCLRSILAQTRSADRIVLVDDRAGDESVPIALALLAASAVDHRVVVQDRNGGPGRARNAGLGVVDTDLVWFVDADDVADPQFLETMTRTLNDADADFAVCRTRRIDEAGRLLGVEDTGSPTGVISGLEFADAVLCGTAKCYPPTKLFRRDLLGADPWLTDQAYEDMAPTLAMACAAHTVAMCDEPLYDYRLRAASLSTALTSSTFDLFRVGDQFAEIVDHQLGALDTGDRRRTTWPAAYLAFRYREVFTSIAHVAMRASHASSTRPELYDAAIERVRAAITLRDVPSLVWERQFRSVIFAVLMTISPELYSAVLRWR